MLSLRSRCYPPSATQTSLSLQSIPDKGFVGVASKTEFSAFNVQTQSGDIKMMLLLKV